MTPRLQQLMVPFPKNSTNQQREALVFWRTIFNTQSSQNTMVEGLVRKIEANHWTQKTKRPSVAAIHNEWPTTRWPVNSRLRKMQLNQSMSEGCYNSTLEMGCLMLFSMYEIPWDCYSVTCCTCLSQMVCGVEALTGTTKAVGKWFSEVCRASSAGYCVKTLCMSIKAVFSDCQGYRVTLAKCFATSKISMAPALQDLDTLEIPSVCALTFSMYIEIQLYV